jgi:sugar transferase (PEP-CTERM system associated)
VNAASISTPANRIASANWRLGVGAWFVVDAFVAFAAMYVAYQLSPYSFVLERPERTPHLGQAEAAVLFGLLTGIASQIFGLHNPLLPRQFWSMFVRCLGSGLLSLAVLSVVVFAVAYSRIGRIILTQAVVYTPLAMALARVSVWQQSEQRKQRLLLLGAGQTGQQVKALIKQAAVPFEVVAFVDHKPELVGQSMGNNTVLGEQQSLKQHCIDLQIDEVVTCIGGKVSDGAMNQLMECLSLGVRVSDFANFVERNFYQVPVENIRGDWFLHADLELAHPLYLWLKRGIDIAAALGGLLLSGPFVLLAAIAIKLESRGPVFYCQTRTGLHNQPFKIWKLRSMRLDAEKDGPQWAKGRDDRVTWVGRILRRTRLDEVPQFWNILCGEMSIVGPRPERPEFVEQLAREIPFYNQRHLVKPGLTGWAQINYPYGAGTDDALNKLKYDLYYIKHSSPGLDLQVILRTIGALMKGAR